MLFRILRRLLAIGYTILVWGCALPFRILVKFTDYVYVSQLISLFPFHIGICVRYEFYKRTLKACGQNVTINFGTVLSYSDITIGNNVWVGQYNIIGHADLKDYTLTAQGCHILSGAHGHVFDRVDVPIILQPLNSERVCIGPDVWLGAATVVMANIGKGCVVGAGSVVVEDLPDWTVSVGAPARIIRYRK